MLFDIQLFAESWAATPVANVKFDVNLNADGYIAKEGDTFAGQKTFTMKGFSATGTPAQANAVLDKIIGDIGGGSYVSNSKVRTITQGVDGEPD
jgi:hypothetical protein